MWTSDTKTPIFKSSLEFLELRKCPPRLNEDHSEMCRIKQADKLGTGMSAPSRVDAYKLAKPS